MSSIESPANHISHNLDDGEMEAFYASLDGETSVLSSSKNAGVSSELTNAVPSEETQRALKTLQDFLSKDFLVLLNPLEYSTMKTTLDYLSSLSMDDGISVETRSSIVEVSREFTHWSWDYLSASSKIEFTIANLLKADELEEGLEANKKHFREHMFLETELHDQLTYLEERKKELEEQINAVKANISASRSAKSMAIKRKREIFEEGKMLKANRDELRVQVPYMRDERELAKKIQENIRDEWLKLGEKVNKSLNL
ncbi:hypothetical protein L6164_006281 [Bauhinia variegata]|uniref:Uncharacterized protein n=1 Tax=Bauhinia variegata TaxID=167791 RepID=A0ACB9PVD7_BAUVA|nr:hypothetical protein L6164_006281 [Bauhinia variegata]